MGRQNARLDAARRRADRVAGRHRRAARGRRRARRLAAPRGRARSRSRRVARARELRTFAAIEFAVGGQRATRDVARACARSRRGRSSTRPRRPRCWGRCRARSASTRPRRATARGATGSGSGRSRRGGSARRRCCVPWSEGGLAEAPSPHAEAVVVPMPVAPSGVGGERDIAAITYGANPEKKGLDRVLAAWLRDGAAGRGARRRGPGRARGRGVAARAGDARDGRRGRGRRGAARRRDRGAGGAGIARAPRTRRARALRRDARAGRVPRAAAARARLRHRRRGARTTGSRSSRRWPTGACSSPRPHPARTPRCRSPARSTRGSSATSSRSGPRSTTRCPTTRSARPRRSRRCRPPRSTASSPSSCLPRLISLSALAQRREVRPRSACWPPAPASARRGGRWRCRTAAGRSSCAEWASESIRTITPASAAARAWNSFMSRRSGAALISIIVPFLAAAAITRGHVDRVGRAGLDLAAGRVADGVEPGVLDRGDHALGHRRLVHPEGGVDRADHPVQALAAARPGSPASRPGGCWTRSRRGRDLAFQPLVERRDLLDPRLERLGRDVVAEPVRGRVVGDREVLPAAPQRPPRPSARASGGRHSTSCGSAGRRAGRSARSASAASRWRAASSSPRPSRSSGGIHA